MTISIYWVLAKFKSSRVFFQNRNTRIMEASLNEKLSQLLTELEKFGAENDQVTTDRPKRMLNITRDTGEFLSVLVKSTNAKRVLEIGTSNGYSTLWLADAARSVGGIVTTIEYSEYKIGLAAKNFTRAELENFIIQIRDDAKSILSTLTDESFDLIFLDSERQQYPDMWADIKRVLRIGGLLVVDNAISHKEQIAPFLQQVEADIHFSTCLVPVGNGEYLAARLPC
jgi:predicted O-methyltransferase YrrM